MTWLTITIPLLFLSLLLPTKGQSQATQEIPFEIIDTTEILRHHHMVRAKFGEDTISLRVLLRPAVYDLDAMKKVKRDSSFQPTKMEEERFIAFMERAAQNCFSNALQWAFQDDDFVSQLFNPDVHIGRQDFEKILRSHFRQTLEIKSDRRKNLKTALDDHSVIVFREKHNISIHAAYFKGNLFYSKNGAHELSAYTRLWQIQRRYPQTTKILIYQRKTLE